jgi:hypothetical protein
VSRIASAELASVAAVRDGFHSFAPLIDAIYPTPLDAYKNLEGVDAPLGVISRHYGALGDTPGVSLL